MQLVLMLWSPSYCFSSYFNHLSQLENFNPQNYGIIFTKTHATHRKKVLIKLPGAISLSSLHHIDFWWEPISNRPACKNDLWNERMPTAPMKSWSSVNCSCSRIFINTTMMYHKRNQHWHFMTKIVIGASDAY